MDVGKRLREVRKSANLSQRELAKRAGVTNSTISMIEADNVSPSVTSLKKVLDGIPITLIDFFAVEEDVSTKQVHYKPADYQETSLNDIKMKLIGKNFPKRSMSFMIEIYPPGASTGAEMYSHPGEEAGIVLKGKIQLIVGDKVHDIAAGESYYIDTTRPHRFLNPYDEVCEFISCATPADF